MTVLEKLYLNLKALIHFLDDDKECITMVDLQDLKYTIKHAEEDVNMNISMYVKKDLFNEIDTEVLIYDDSIIEPERILIGLAIRELQNYIRDEVDARIIVIDCIGYGKNNIVDVYKTEISSNISVLGYISDGDYSIINQDIENVIFVVFGDHKKVDYKTLPGNVKKIYIECDTSI